MGKPTKEMNRLNLTVVALVALVAIVGLVALVLNAASLATMSENTRASVQQEQHQEFGTPSVAVSGLSAQREIAGGDDGAA